MADELTDRLDRLEDQLSRIAPIIEALGELVVEADYVTRAKRLNRNTISDNAKLEKFQGIGHRKTLLKLSSVATVKKRKRSDHR